jgi:hypothetical protein
LYIADYIIPQSGIKNFASELTAVLRTSDTLHMIEQGGSPEDIPLPRAEPIPQHHWPQAEFKKTPTFSFRRVRKFQL